MLEKTFDYALSLRDINLTRDGRKILNNVTLDILKGQVYTLLGRNGAGKSTLAYVVMGIESPDSGSVLYDNKDITSLATFKRSKLGISLAFQELPSFEGLSVKDYLEISCRNQSLDLVCDSLYLMGLNPKEYLHREMNSKLSGGERKRIELASVLASTSKLVILDEPDSGIDLISLELLEKAIDYFKRQDTTIIQITHREQLATLSDQVALLCKGSVVRVGSPHEILDYFKCNTCEAING